MQVGRTAGGGGGRRAGQRRCLCGRPTSPRQVNDVWYVAVVHRGRLSVNTQRPFPRPHPPPPRGPPPTPPSHADGRAACNRSTPTRHSWAGSGALLLPVRPARAAPSPSASSHRRLTSRDLRRAAASHQRAAAGRLSKAAVRL